MCAAGGRKRKAGKLQKVLPWDQQHHSDSEEGIPAGALQPQNGAPSAAAAAGGEGEQHCAADAAAADAQLPGVNGGLHYPGAGTGATAAAPVGDSNRPAGLTLADFARAEAAAAAAAAGMGYETTPGSTPAKSFLPGHHEDDMAEGEGSNAELLSPGALAACM